MQHGDIDAKELNSIGVYAKKVIVYGWDTTNLTPVRLACDSDGNLLVGNGLDIYKLSDEDGSEPAYYGYLSKTGTWYIMQATTSGNVVSYRFYKGDTDYTTNWTNRASLGYGYFNAIF